MHQCIHICLFICALNMCGSARAGVPESDSRWTRDQQRKAQLLFIAQSTVSITRSAIAFKATCSTTASTGGILYISIQESNPATWTSHKAPNDKEFSPNRLWRPQAKRRVQHFQKVSAIYWQKEHEWSPLISIGTKQKTNVSHLCRCCFVKACLFPEFEKKTWMSVLLHSSLPVSCENMTHKSAPNKNSRVILTQSPYLRSNECKYI